MGIWGRAIVEPHTETHREDAAVTEERRLVEAARNGDVAAFDLLVERHWRKVASLISRLLPNAADVEDTVQETFVRAFERLPEFRGEAGLQTWLIRIAINLCKNRRLTFWQRRVVLLGERDTPPPHPNDLGDSDAALFAGEWGRAVLAAVHQLPDKYRLPILLHYYEDLTGAQIAEALGWRQCTVWSRIYAGCRSLRKTLAAWQES